MGHKLSRPHLRCILTTLAALSLSTAAFATPRKGVQVIPDEANRRVDITIDGKPFTSYI